jgi:hypothetical protein
MQGLQNTVNQIVFDVRLNNTVEPMVSAKLIGKRCNIYKMLFSHQSCSDFSETHVLLM